MLYYIKKLKDIYFLCYRRISPFVFSASEVSQVEKNEEVQFAQRSGTLYGSHDTVFLQQIHKEM